MIDWNTDIKELYRVGEELRDTAILLYIDGVACLAFYGYDSEGYADDARLGFWECEYYEYSYGYSHTPIEEAEITAWSIINEPT